MVIPKSRAGYSRVTHPFAARVPRRAFPLDLHVLSTPPALVLSQGESLQQRPCCQRNLPPIPKRTGRGIAIIGTGLSSTLLSSQRTTAFRKLPGRTRSNLPA